MNIGAVTGREYTKTRVRGYAPWKPKATTIEIIDRMIEIIAEYDTALTIRQIFYRLVGKYLAVTQEQATQYNLVSAPQKAADRRGEKMPETWQAEALDPAVLAEIVRAELARLIGVDALQLAEQRTEKERAVVLAAVKNVRR